jgi:hypothetical protein
MEQDVELPETKKRKSRKPLWGAAFALLPGGPEGMPTQTV